MLHQTKRKKVKIIKFDKMFNSVTHSFPFLYKKHKLLGCRVCEATHSLHEKGLIGVNENETYNETLMIKHNS